MLEQPVLCLTQRPPAQRFPRDALIQLEATIERQKEIPPTKKLLVPIKCEGLARCVLIQRVHTNSARYAKERFMRVENGQRNNDSARPRRHLVNINREPIRKKHQLRRNR